MNNLTNRILKRYGLSSQKTKLSLIDDIREYKNQLDFLAFGIGKSEVKKLQDEIVSLLSDAKSKAEALDAEIEIYRNTDWQSVINEAEDALDTYKNAAEELGVELDSDAQTLDELIGDWYDNGKEIYDDEPDTTYYIEQANKIDL